MTDKKVEPASHEYRHHESRLLHPFLCDTFQARTYHRFHVILLISFKKWALNSENNPITSEESVKKHKSMQLQDTGGSEKYQLINTQLDPSGTFKSPLFDNSMSKMTFFVCSRQWTHPKVRVKTEHF